MLSEKAQMIFDRKYALTINGVKETWEQACWRVAFYVAQAEKEHGATDEEVLEWAKIFYRLMVNKIFIPGGRILANAGTEIKNMFNCFVIPIEDSRVGIYKALGTSAEIFAHGGGVGFNFSHLREKGALIKKTGGRASGPLSFMDLFDYTGEVISQASRRGAQLATLNVDHPEIEAFVNFKSIPNNRNERYLNEIHNTLDKNNIDNTNLIMPIIEHVLTDNQLSHFNISVGVTDVFMEAVEQDTSWDLISRVDGSIVKTISAKQLMKQIAESAWRSGDPGIIFLDRMEAGNMVPYLGKIESTNPCGEVGLLPNEPCCLGSINLASFVDNKRLISEDIVYVTTIAIRFLDNVHTLNKTPIEEINTTAANTRRLGLGIMGWADMLVKLGISYDSDTSLELAENVMKIINAAGWSTSELLAKERGPFNAWDETKVVNTTNFYEDKLPPLRNVAITSIAPTGTISLLCDVNSGIEPFFALAYKRYVTDGIGNNAKHVIYEYNPYLKDYIQDESILSFVKENGVLPDNVPEEVRDLFKTAGEIHWKRHIDVQAAFQKYVSNSISKTINLPEDVTVEDIMSAYIYAWKAGLKSMTVYRDKSKNFQILNK